jgi:N-methylhydantoinase A
MERSIDMMYRGQWRSLAVPTGGPVGPISDLVAGFHIQHERQYNFRRNEAPVDIYRLNLRGGYRTKGCLP